VLLKPGETRRVPLPAGDLERLWSTADQPDKLDLQFEFEPGAPKVHLIGTGATPLTDKTFIHYGGYVSNFIFGDGHVKGGHGLGSSGTLVATNRAKVPNKWFYQATVRPISTPQVLAPIGTPKIIKAQRMLRTGDSLGAVNVSGGLSQGFVSEVKITLQPATLETWNRCFLRGWATQKPKPLGSISEEQSAPTEFNPKFAIDAPLLAFTGQFFGAAPKRDAVSDFDGKTLTLRWPLPFDARRDSPALDIVNLSAGRVTVSLQATVLGLGSPPPTIFHAHFGSALSKIGKPISVAQVQGAGAFVGLALAIRPDANSKRRAFAYLEGNETMTSDGKRFEGTGTEDFFNSAWYFPDKPFARPFGGETWKQALPPQVVAYRWMVPDPLPFKREFGFEFEHGNRNNANDLEYRWLACFYATPSSTWSVPDELSGNPDVGADPRRDSDREARVRRYVLGMTVALLGAAALYGLWSLLRRKSGK